MAKYTSVLHQLLRHVPRDEFRAIVERHQGDKGVRTLSCWGQFVGLFFGQLTGQHSLSRKCEAKEENLEPLGDD